MSRRSLLRGVDNSLILVDVLVGLLAVEEVGHKLDGTRNTCRTADQDDFTDVRLANLESRRTFSTGLRALRKRSCTALRNEHE
jgi:hypothetical protein